MKVGADDWAKVYLNGKEVYRRGLHAPYVADTDVVAGVELRAGVNVLVFKLLNGVGHWLGSVRFTDRDGKPVPGIRVTLNPDNPNPSAP